MTTEYPASAGRPHNADLERKGLSGWETGENRGILLGHDAQLSAFTGIVAAHIYAYRPDNPRSGKDLSVPGAEFISIFELPNGKSVYRLELGWTNDKGQRVPTTYLWFRDLAEIQKFQDDMAQIVAIAEAAVGFLGAAGGIAAWRAAKLKQHQLQMEQKAANPAAADKGDTTDF